MMSDVSASVCKYVTALDNPRQFQVVTLRLLQGEWRWRGVENEFAVVEA